MSPLPQASHRVAADVVALAPDAAAGDLTPVVLTVRRLRPPFEGDWALPGTMVRSGEDLEAAARRVLAAAGLLQPRHLEQLATFGAPDRDPRGRVVSVSYLALIPQPTPVLGAARWCSAFAPPTLAFDHEQILTGALRRLRGKLSYSNIAYGLLPEAFTLSDLQRIYEAVLGGQLDRRNFRKKVLALNMVTEAPGQRRGPHRPAQLYRFSSRVLTVLDDVAPPIGAGARP